LLRILSTDPSAEPRMQVNVTPRSQAGAVILAASLPVAGFSGSAPNARAALKPRPASADTIQQM